jgi:hypothetical protein
MSLPAALIVCRKVLVSKNYLCAGTVEVADDGGHASLVAKSGRQVDGLLGVILGEGLDLTAAAGSPLINVLGSIVKCRNAFL